VRKTIIIIAIAITAAAGGGIAYARMSTYDSIGRDLLNVNVNRGTVGDHALGVVWERAEWPGTDAKGVTIGGVAYSTAVAYCQNLSLGGLTTGWRVPTIYELLHIVDYSDRSFDATGATNPGPQIRTQFQMPSWVDINLWSSTNAPLADTGGTPSVFQVKTETGSIINSAVPDGPGAGVLCVHDT
jgi:hypothetical protein